MPKHNDMRAMLEWMRFDDERPSFYLLNIGETHYPYALPDEPEDQWPRISGVHGVFKHLDHGSRTVIPADIRDSAQFRSAVVIHLIEAIEEEYDEAVDDGKVVNVAEYQDAFGFLQRVQALTNQLADGRQAGDRQQLTSLLKSLEGALPTIAPPASPVSPEVVNKEANALVALLKKSTAK